MTKESKRKTNGRTRTISDCNWLSEIERMEPTLKMIEELEEGRESFEWREREKVRLISRKRR